MFVLLSRIQAADGKLQLTHARNNSEFSLAALNSFRPQMRGVLDRTQKLKLILESFRNLVLN
jgi:hypothetical protein